MGETKMEKMKSFRIQTFEIKMGVRPRLSPVLSNAILENTVHPI